jgi:hypothetical protein
MAAGVPVPVEAKVALSPEALDSLDSPEQPTPKKAAHKAHVTRAASNFFFGIIIPFSGGRHESQPYDPAIKASSRTPFS